MGSQVINGNSVEPLGISNMGVSTEQGDSWNTAVTKLNAMFAELYGRTGGTGTPTASAMPKNLIDCGDFSTNPFQRGVSFSSITALAYTADRWFAVGVGGASYSILVQSAVTTTNQGFTTALQFGRSNSDSHATTVYLGQVIETANSVRTQGQQVTLSFYAAAGGNFAAGASGSAINVQVIQGTGTNQAALSMVAGSWTNQSFVINTTQSGFSTTAYNRYSFTGTVTGIAKQLGVLFSYVGSGTAGSNEYILLEGIQLEIGNTATSYEFKDIQIDLELAQRYYFQINEPISGVVVATGFIQQTNQAAFYTALPVQMRTAPTVTFVGGAFRIAIAASIGGLVTTGYAAGGTHTANYIQLTASGTAASGLGAFLIGFGSNGYIGVSAEF